MFGHAAVPGGVINKSHACRALHQLCSHKLPCCPAIPDGRRPGRSAGATGAAAWPLCGRLTGLGVGSGRSRQLGRRRAQLRRRRDVGAQRRTQHVGNRLAFMTGRAIDTGRLGSGVSLRTEAPGGGIRRRWRGLLRGPTLSFWVGPSSSLPKVIFADGGVARRGCRLRPSAGSRAGSARRPRWRMRSSLLVHLVGEVALDKPRRIHRRAAHAARPSPIARLHAFGGGVAVVAFFASAW